jgi:hypothetical protein
MALLRLPVAASPPIYLSRVRAFRASEINFAASRSSNTKRSANFVIPSENTSPVRTEESLVVIPKGTRPSATDNGKRCLDSARHDKKATGKSRPRAVVCKKSRHLAIACQTKNFPRCITCSPSNQISKSRPTQSMCVLDLQFAPVCSA